MNVIDEEYSKDARHSLNQIKQSLYYYEDRITELEEENEHLKDEHYKDAEMADMKRQLASLQEAYYRGFPLTEEQERKINEWKKKHDTDEHSNPCGYHGVSGGGFAYIFYPTAIGTSIECHCNICHERALNYAIEQMNAYAYNQYLREHNAIIEINDFQGSRLKWQEIEKQLVNSTSVNGNVNVVAWQSSMANASIAISMSPH